MPVTLGQEFAGYAAQVREGKARVESTLERLGKVPLGGTAVGTGLNTHPEFAARVRTRLAEDTGLPSSTVYKRLRELMERAPCRDWTTGESWAALVP